MTTSRGNRIVHLAEGGTSVVVEIPARGVPAMVHWGPSLGVVGPRELTEMVAANRPQQRVGDIDAPSVVGLVPAAAEGWTGAPGLEGHRARSAFSPAFVCVGAVVGERSLVLSCADSESALALEIEIQVDPSGLVRQRLTLTNEGESEYELQALRAVYPIPDSDDEILDLTGRWMRERVPQRHPLTVGRYVRESRKGRPGADASLMLLTGKRGFRFERGPVRSVHVAWSGNHELAVERTILGGAVLTGGELLLPGEIVLARGESYSTPWVYASHGDGLDDMASRYHRFLRAGAARAGAARPVIINVWEAVYFDHDFDTLAQLAELGAGIGAELFMLDDGWFLGRRDDRRALGDWYVDPAIWPDGLRPLIDRVRGLGLRFGIWVEPEMVSVDSLLAREHPEWILRPGSRMPPAAKWQQVLDFSNPEAFAYILARLDWLLTEHDIDYLKWDHNRDVLEPGDGSRARLHEHTLAVYRMLDELRRRHPSVEFENCASGGSRIDLEILARTERTWLSDCADPLERALVQQYTGLLVPPENAGNDIGSAVSHTTGRASHIDLRGGIAFLGYLGIQWDLTKATARERAELADWVSSYKANRGLIHSGRAVSLDHPDPAVLVRGVVAQDRAEALFVFAQLTSSLAPSAGRIRFAGLDPDGAYRVCLDEPRHAPRSRAYTPLGWLTDGVVLSGRVLQLVGLEAPVLDPEQAILIRLSRV